MIADIPEAIKKLMAMAFAKTSNLMNCILELDIILFFQGINP